MVAGVDAETLSAEFSRNDEYVRQLTIMESALEGRTGLDCSVSEDEDPLSMNFTNTLCGILENTLRFLS
jgi:hypothetical protein